MEDEQMRIAVCPGSYDPVTKGHINIIERCSRLFDKVIVVVMVNHAKTTSFSKEQRVQMLTMSIRKLYNVEVDAYDGLVAEYARLRGASALVKGLRAMSDFEYEFQMAQVNKSLNPQLETLFINADAQYTFCSSSTVKEIARVGANISGFVPEEVHEIVQSHFRANSRTRDHSPKILEADFFSNSG